MIISLMVLSIFTSCTNIQKNPPRAVPVKKYEIFEESNLITGLQDFDREYKKNSF